MTKVICGAAAMALVVLVFVQFSLAFIQGPQRQPQNQPPELQVEPLLSNVTLENALNAEYRRENGELILERVVRDVRASNSPVQYQIGTAGNLGVFVPAEISVSAFRTQLDAIGDDALTLNDETPITRCSGEYQCVETCTDESGEEYCCKWRCETG